ncbi:DUF1345 domain-containing protein [Microbacterium sp. No. 7]|uniref:DUF1345 domain-containing protein n=1 Tax=Microbacterium sp. No. 7 TaxID=1714373 RepID=UPI0006D26241|nr:DUF1345 domain-containing protein [Microbacterium sp. No. 7]ALJ20277.1 hypothetical protein AOA12_10285 [Microbacterium sp. No. 7]
MWHRRRPGEIPLRYDDNFRGHMASLVALVAPLVIVVVSALEGTTLRGDDADLTTLFAAAAVALSTFFAVYIVWTHRLFARADPAEAARIAARQHDREPGPLASFFGFGGTLDWALGAASLALLVSIVGSLVVPRSGELWMPALIVMTTAGAWTTMTYAFALRYFRLHAAGERIEFDIDEEPRFIDFVSMAVMVSSVGALSAGTPRTRASLSAVRSHTALAFAFNAFVVAMVVSLVTGVITASS